MAHVSAIPLNVESPADSKAGNESTASAPTLPGERSVEALALEAREGSHRAFEGLVTRFEEPLFRFFLVRGHNPTDAEEATQEALVQAWQAIERYDPRWRFSTWLYTIAKRQAISRLRRSRARGEEEGLAPELFDLTGAGDSGDPARLAEDREEKENLWAVARRVLKVDERTALWLRYAEDLPADEIAAVLGRRTVSVRVLLFRARKKLVRHVERPGGSE